VTWAALALLCAATPTLTPRAAFLGTPERSAPQLSPDASLLAYLAVDRNQVSQLVVRPLSGTDAQAKVLTQEPRRSLRRFAWAEDSRTLLVLQDEDGDENFHLAAIDALDGNRRELTPFAGVRVDLLATNPKVPDQVLVTMNQRDRKAFDVLRLTLSTGALTLDTRNPGDVTAWVVDPAFQVRGAVATLRSGATEVRVREGPKAPWRALVSAGVEEELGVVGFGFEGKSVFLTSSLLSDTTRVLDKVLSTGAERTVARHPTSDVREVVFHPSRFVVQAVRVEEDGKPVWQYVDGVRGDFEAIGAQAPGLLSLLSRDRADQVWTVAIARDDAPPRFFLWERAAKRLSPLFSAYPALDGVTLAPLEPVTVTARDGLKLPAFLARPPGEGPGPFPLVVQVHGGPWSRDEWGFAPQTQWLASRGYAVLRVNYRGSTGFGKRHLNAGNKQWGKAMQDDLADGAAWAVAQGIADRERIAILGQSYGGYAALVGATTGDYRCAVDLVGPANLFTLLASVPPYWDAMKKMFLKRIGDPVADQALLRAASPAFAADRIVKPLLIGQGLNDPRVKRAESDQMVKALGAAGRGVTYVMYPDEGHGLVRAENRLDFAARTEAFLSECLGGRAEPLPASGVIEGSSAQVTVVRAQGPR